MALLDSVSKTISDEEGVGPESLSEGWPGVGGDTETQNLNEFGVGNISANFR